MTTLPITLPPGFFPQVKIGDAITAGQTIAKKEKKPDEVIDLAKELSIPIEEVAKTLKKNPGDTIQPGDTIAAKGGLFGEKKVVSGISGTLLRFERNTGHVVIRLDTPSQESAAKDEKSSHEDVILSPLDGTVSLCNNDTIHVQTDKNVLLAEKGIGDPVEGEVAKADGLLRNANILADEIIPADLTTDLIGKIIVGGKYNREVLTKAVGMGVVGIIASDISDEDLDYLASKNIQATIAVLNKESLEKIVKWVGKKAYLDGKGKTILLLRYESKRI